MVLIADFHLVPDGLGTLTALLLNDCTDGADNALAAAVDLGDLYAGLLLEKLAQICILGQAGLGCGDENAYSVN